MTKPLESNRKLTRSKSSMASKGGGGPIIGAIGTGCCEEVRMRVGRLIGNENNYWRRAHWNWLCSLIAQRCNWRTSGSLTVVERFQSSTNIKMTRTSTGL